MAEPYNISIRVVSQEGTCDEEHKVGQKWVTKGKTPEGICLPAFNSLHPFLQVLMYGGSFPWENDPHVTTVACPDPINRVVFELRRLRQ